MKKKKKKSLESKKSGTNCTSEKKLNIKTREKKV